MKKEAHEQEFNKLAHWKKQCKLQRKHVLLKKTIILSGENNFHAYLHYFQDDSTDIFLNSKIKKTPFWILFLSLIYILYFKKTNQEN